MSEPQRVVISLTTPEGLLQDTSPCGAAPWVYGELAEGVAYCDRNTHSVADGSPRGVVVGPCPAEVARVVSGRIGSERKRLAGALAKIARTGTPGFAGYDSGRHESATRALMATQAMAAGRPPDRGVVMIGTLGLGKTHLMLASHFELLAGGIVSRYVVTSELRALFRSAASFDEEREREARAALDRLRWAQVVHLDDLGDVERDERRRGDFAEGLKDLLDSSRAVWCVATNCTWSEAEKHPDIGSKLLSRIIDGSVLVKMNGADQRAPHEVRR